MTPFDDALVPFDFQYISFDGVLMYVGPFIVEAGDVFTPGAVIGDTFLPGSEAGDLK
jgi:hypothetical protein